MTGGSSPGRVPGSGSGIPPLGPVEAEVLGELAPGVVPRACPLAGGGTLRLLEGGEGPPLVLLHGRGSAASTWFPLLPALVREHRVLAVDLPGFGGSPAAPGPLRTAEDGLRFFVEPVEAVLSALAPGPMTLVGHSLGGLVALELALRGRVPVERLVLVDAMGLGPEMAREARLYFRVGPERLARVLGPKLFGRIAPLPDTPHRHRLMALDYELMTVSGGRTRATRAFNTLVPLTGDVFHRRERLGEVKPPTVYLWGENDGVLPVSLAEAAVRAQPCARLVRVRTGHSPHLEQPECLLSALRA
ncbi:Menaquinone biosynthesis related protein, putative DHNA-CoA thioesterase [Cystobacter fuscus DSM 2262]|uniref:Menaquinone biosynthesis related protein, putative DHNA-CoA thioesterase n=1 Tax=Cystobacter fuscus (strain ATCC 25194 / DSM 2262 / NBRC 100088 / M29) TaxID=1242864 RepID=S9QP27_CYSF2|nr:alpha/beta hydrolase [Cystobacter fuscus]EPX63054.1 Menaquinone biosynthesis related protein, putative DHNA-CoA thioesterase [Cystobacter fuscus DSM 2262]